MIRKVAALLIVAAAGQLRPDTAPSDIRFEDTAARAGLTVRTVFGGEKSKRYILETTGGGAAFFDFVPLSPFALPSSYDMPGKNFLEFRQRRVIL